MTEKQFIETYCNKCGTQRCEGIGTEWFNGCQNRWNLDGTDPAKEIKRLNELILKLSSQIVSLNNKQASSGKFINADSINTILEKFYREPLYQHEGEDWFVGICDVAQELRALPVFTLEPVENK